MPLSKQKVIAHIHDAFRGVTLGNGIGLLEADAIDDYADDATRKACRQRDEREDWQRISPENLHGEGLCFTDSEGMRFLLPAYLIAELNGALSASCVFFLTHLDDYVKSKCVALSPEQRKAVREFLLLVRDGADYEFDRPQIERALSDYWTSDETEQKG